MMDKKTIGIVAGIAGLAAVLFLVNDALVFTIQELPESTENSNEIIMDRSVSETEIIGKPAVVIAVDHSTQDQKVKAFGFDPDKVKTQENTNRQPTDRNSQSAEEMYPAIAALLNQNPPEGHDEAIREAELERVALVIDEKVEEIRESMKVFSGHDDPSVNHYKDLAEKRLSALEELRSRIR